MTGGIVGAVLGLYLVSVFVAVFVLRVRGGHGLVDRIQVTGANGVGATAILKMVGTAFIWPYALYRWIVDGRKAQDNYGQL